MGGSEIVVPLLLSVAPLPSHAGAGMLYIPSSPWQRDLDRAHHHHGNGKSLPYPQQTQNDLKQPTLATQKTERWNQVHHAGTNQLVWNAQAHPPTTAVNHQHRCYPPPSPRPVLCWSE